MFNPTHILRRGISSPIECEFISENAVTGVAVIRIKCGEEITECKVPYENVRPMRKA